MKKILTVSLVAMMAVSAARAEIASTAYVTGQISAEVQRADGAYAAKTLESTVGNLATTVGTNKAAADQTQADLDTLEEKVAGLQGTGDQAAATKKELADLTQTVTDNETDIEDKMTTLSGRVDTAEDKITTLTGADTVDGSVANAKKAGTDASEALNAYKIEMTAALSGKQGTISDLETIRTQAGAALSKTDAVSTYAPISTTYTKTEVNTALEAKEDLTNKVTKTQGFSEAEKDSTTLYPSMATTGALIAESASSVRDEINAINDVNTGILASAKGYTDGKISAEAQAREGAVSAINTEIDNMDLAEVKEAGKAIVSISEADGNVIAAVGEINSAGITDGSIVDADIAAGAAIAQSKIAGLADSLTAATAAALTQLADKSTDGTDGVYTLTMKQVEGVKTLVWEKIAR